MYKPFNCSHRLLWGKTADLAVMPISHIDEEREGILIYGDSIKEGLVCIYDSCFS